MLQPSGADAALHQFNEGYRICTSNTNPCVTTLICKCCRIMHLLPFLRLLWLQKVTTTSRSLSLSFSLSTAQKTPPGMLLGPIRREIGPFRLCWRLIVVWQDIPGGSFSPRLLSVCPSCSLCFQHLLKVRYGNNSSPYAPVCEGPAKLTAPEEKKKRNKARNQTWNVNSELCSFWSHMRGIKREKYLFIIIDQIINKQTPKQWHISKKRFLEQIVNQTNQIETNTAEVHASIVVMVSYICVL